MNARDRELGMHRRITRRDFLDGIALSVAALGGKRMFGEGAPYYPPTLTGLRGDHDGIYKTPHAVRDHTYFQNAGPAVDTGQTYDLAIVGGGISGLAAAHFYRKTQGRNARVLILENHDDFGGHAKRNEFHQTGRMLLAYGGTFSIESPKLYSDVARQLVAELGVDVRSNARVFDRKLYPKLGLSPAVFFSKEQFGRDVLVIEPVPDTYAEPAPKQTADERWRVFSDAAPISDKAKSDLRRLYSDKKDYLPGLSSDAKKARLARMSYAAFLTELVGVHQDVVKYFQPRPYGLFGVGIDAVSAQDAWGLGFPGFDGMSLDPKPGPGQNHDAIRTEEGENYFFHFPDGNASIARLLVRELIPSAVPGTGATDIVGARADYSCLDREDSPVRIRLNSTVVRAEQDGREVTLTYAGPDGLKKVRGRQCILACWHVMIPYICADLADDQKKALSFAVKVPLVYTNVVMKNWLAFQKLGVSAVYAPGSYHTEMNLDLPVSIGDYRCPRDPSSSIVVHMMRVPCRPGLAARDQHRAGRQELFETSFDTFERNIRDQMARTLSAGGFDPAADIAAITVNRWPHGYAYQYNSLWDPFWLAGEEGPCAVARKPFGRIAIANSDAGAYAYTDCAIDQAYRAVQDLMRNS